MINKISLNLRSSPKAWMPEIVVATTVITTTSHKHHGECSDINKIKGN